MQLLPWNNLQDDHVSVVQVQGDVSVRYEGNVEENEVGIVHVVRDGLLVVVGNGQTPLSGQCVLQVVDNVHDGRFGVVVPGGRKRRSKGRKLCVQDEKVEQRDVQVSFQAQAQVQG